MINHINLIIISDNYEINNPKEQLKFDLAIEIYDYFLGEIYEKEKREHYYWTPRLYLDFSNKTNLGLTYEGDYSHA